LLAEFSGLLSHSNIVFPTPVHEGAYLKTTITDNKVIKHSNVCGGDKLPTIYALKCNTWSLYKLLRSWRSYNQRRAGLPRSDIANAGDCYLEHRAKFLGWAN